MSSVELSEEAQYSEDDWTSDGRGVSKDLQRKGARQYYQDAKQALEESKTLKRELRARAIENMSNMYELILSLADSRQRHRINLEVEKTRAAREILRVQRAHETNYNKKYTALSIGLAEQQDTMKGTRMRWRRHRQCLSNEMKKILETMLTVKEEVTKAMHPPLPSKFKRSKVSNQAPAKKVKSSKRCLHQIKIKLGDLGNEIFYLKQQGSGTPPKPSQKLRSPSKSPQQAEKSEARDESTSRTCTTGHRGRDCRNRRGIHAEGHHNPVKGGRGWDGRPVESDYQVTHVDKYRTKK
ncbi:hypothetical protein ACJJTC_015959 [Scirpophaga incertulas]